MNGRVPEIHVRLNITSISQPTMETTFSVPFALLTLAQYQPISKYIILWILPCLKKRPFGLPLPKQPFLCLIRDSPLLYKFQVFRLGY